MIPFANEHLLSTTDCHECNIKKFRGNKKILQSRSAGAASQGLVGVRKGTVTQNWAGEKNRAKMAKEALHAQYASAYFVSNVTGPFMARLYAQNA